jgi:hypothetical protein
MHRTWFSGEAYYQANVCFWLRKIHLGLQRKCAMHRKWHYGLPPAAIGPFSKHATQQFCASAYNHWFTIKYTDVHVRWSYATRFKIVLGFFHSTFGLRVISHSHPARHVYRQKSPTNSLDMNPCVCLWAYPKKLLKTRKTKRKKESMEPKECNLGI